MKKLKTLALALALALAATVFMTAATGCTSETKYGECRGLAEDRDPNLDYDVDVGNLVLAAIFSQTIFSQTIFVPVIMALDEFECPTGVKKTNAGPNETLGEGEGEGQQL